MLNQWMNDLRLALRSLRRTPGFALLAVITLGLAIGANTGIMSVVDAVLLDPLPYNNNDRLVHLSGSAPGSDFPEEFPLPLEFFVQFRDSELIEDISTFNAFTSTLRVGDRIERIPLSFPTVSMFTTLGVQPVLGRLPVPEDEDRVVVISHALWTTWFGSDPDILGKSYYVSGQDRAVIGVMGPEFWFPTDSVLLWIPQNIQVEDVQPDSFSQNLVARLKPGTKVETLKAELVTLAQQLPDRFGEDLNYVPILENFHPVVRPLEEHLLGQVSVLLWILLGSMGIVLLIACANVANLFMVRAERRLPDLAVQRALGAARGRLISSQLAESILIAAFAGVLAVGLAWFGVPLLLAVTPANVPRLDEVDMSFGTLLFTFGACIFAALLCGLAPAVRFSSPNLSQLREGGRGSLRRASWGRNVLVAGQTALALVLLIGSALLLRSFDKLRNVDPGYSTENLFTFQIAPTGEHLNDAFTFARFHLDFMERVKALPGVEEVGMVNNVPLDEAVSRQRFFTEDLPDGDPGTLLSFTFSAGEYFSAMDIEVFQGRTFLGADHDTERGNVLVSRSAAELLWPGADAIGQRVRMGGLESWETVVGVVDDVLQYDFRRAPEPMVYFPFVGQNPESWIISSPGYVVKSARASEIAPEILTLVREVAPTAPMYRQYTLETLAARSMVELSFTALGLGIASALALILGLVGLYGVLSYAVAERTREIGLRMALGAMAGQVRRMVVGQGVRVLLVGIVLGTAAAYGATRALGGLLFGVEAFDLTTYLGVSVLMVLVGLLASWVPAHRASRVDPMEALRME